MKQPSSGIVAVAIRSLNNHSKRRAGLLSLRCVFLLSGPTVGGVGGAFAPASEATAPSLF